VGSRETFIVRPSKETNMLKPKYMNHMLPFFTFIVLVFFRSKSSDSKIKQLNGKAKMGSFYLFT
jgi:hypothetical protein